MPPVKLLVIGPSKEGESLKDDVFKTVTAMQPPALRCSSPEELLKCVDDARGGELVSRLDIFEHGAEGLLKLGDAPLFRADGTGWGLAYDLASRMTPDAELRLIGCRVACVEAGQKLLLGLERVLGEQRTVWGGTTTIEQYEFDANGFIDEVAWFFLESSTKLKGGGHAPSLVARLRAVEATWRARNT